MGAVAHIVEENPRVFSTRFCRSYRMLQLIAGRILGDPGRAEIAIRNCWRTARRHSPRFKYEGEFRGWLLRVLIDEALALRHEAQQAVEPDASLQLAAQASWPEHSYRHAAQHRG